MGLKDFAKGLKSLQSGKMSPEEEKRFRAMMAKDNDDRGKTTTARGKGGVTSSRMTDRQLELYKDVSETANRKRNLAALAAGYSDSETASTRVAKNEAWSKLVEIYGGNEKKAAKAMKEVADAMKKGETVDGAVKKLVKGAGRKAVERLLKK